MLQISMIVFFSHTILQNRSGLVESWKAVEQIKKRADLVRAYIVQWELGNNINHLLHSVQTIKYHKHFNCCYSWVEHNKETAESDQLEPESYIYTQGKSNHSHRVVVLLFHHYSQP